MMWFTTSKCACHVILVCQKESVYCNGLLISHLCHYLRIPFSSFGSICKQCWTSLFITVDALYEHMYVQHAMSVFCRRKQQKHLWEMSCLSPSHQTTHPPCLTFLMMTWPLLHLSVYVFETCYTILDECVYMRMLPRGTHVGMGDSVLDTLSVHPSFQPNTSGYEEFSDEEITFGDDDFDQEVCDQTVHTVHAIVVVRANYSIMYMHAIATHW